MYLLLLLDIGASTASPLGFQGTPMNVVNASRCHFLSLVRLRNERANSLPTAVPTMTSSLSSVRPRNVSVAQRGSSFATSPSTILKSTVSTTCASGLSHSLAPQTGPRTTVIVSLHKTTERVRRVPDKPTVEQCCCCRLCSQASPATHTHVSSREALDPSHCIPDRTI